MLEYLELRRFFAQFLVEKPSDVGAPCPEILAIIKEEDITEINEDAACKGYLPWR